MTGHLERRTAGISLVVGGLLALGCNLALPHEDDDFAFVQEVARSDTWPWLHAGLFLGVVLLLLGLRELVEVVRPAGSAVADRAAGALVIGGALMLSALVVAGTAFRKAADNVRFVGEGRDLSGSFFSALGLDRLAYALYAGAAVLLLGLVPIALGLGLWRSRIAPGLGLAGLTVGALSVVVGLVQLTTETDTFTAYLVVSLAVTAWAVAAGVWLLRSEAPRVRPD